MADTRATSTYTRLPDHGWRRAARCGPNGGNCVEVNRTPSMVGVRDSKPAASPVLTFDTEGWQRFLSAATQGDLHR